MKRRSLFYLVVAVTVAHVGLLLGLNANVAVRHRPQTEPRDFTAAEKTFFDDQGRPLQTVHEYTLPAEPRDDARFAAPGSAR